MSPRVKSFTITIHYCVPHDSICKDIRCPICETAGEYPVDEPCDIQTLRILLKRMPA